MPSRGLDILLQLDSLVAQMVKNLPGVQETQVRSLGWEDPWRRESLPTPEFFPEQRRLASYNQSIGSQRVRHD